MMYVFRVGLVMLIFLFLIKPSPLFNLLIQVDCNL